MGRIAVVLVSGLSALALAVTVWMLVDPVQSANGAAPPNSPSPAGVESGNCTMSKVKFKTSDIFALTTSTSYVDVPDMSATFTVGGSIATCVEVLFSGEVATEAEGMRVRAVLDGAAGLPTNVLFADNANFFGAHAFHFAFKNVAPGAHTVKVQWRSQGGGEIYIDTRSLFIHYQ